MLRIYGFGPPLPGESNFLSESGTENCYTNENYFYDQIVPQPSLCPKISQWFFFKMSNLLADVVPVALGEQDQRHVRVLD